MHVVAALGLLVLMLFIVSVMPSPLPGSRE